MRGTIHAIIILIATTWTNVGSPCTLFSSTQDSMFFAGKLRDTPTHHDQEIHVIHPQRKGERLSYLGLFAVRGPRSITYSPLKMGVNEKGLFVAFATPSSIPRSVRWSLPYFKDLTHQLLTQSSSVEDALNWLKTTQEGGTPLGLRILLIADGDGSVMIENGTGTNNLYTRPSKTGTTLATNHFQSPELKHYNWLANSDSSSRLQAAHEFLHNNRWSSNEEIHRNLKALWTSNPQDPTPTRSDFFVFYPPGGSPFVKVRIENQGQISIQEYRLKDVFNNNQCLSHLAQLVN